MRDWLLRDDPTATERGFADGRAGSPTMLRLTNFSESILTISVAI